MTTIPQILFSQAQSRPKALAIQDGNWQLNYDELAAQVKLVAGKLHYMGLVAGDRFGIWAPNCAEWIIFALAGQSLGAVLVTLNTRYKGGEAADILRRAKCKFLFTVQGFLNHDYASMLADHYLPSLIETVIVKSGDGQSAYDDFLNRAGEPLKESQARSEDICDIIFTSGTTGAPKGAMTSHDQNIRVFESFTQAIGMTQKDRYLIVNPFFHSFGYKAGWLSCLIRGAAIYPLSMFEPRSILEQIERDKITVMPGAPTIFQTLLDYPDLKDFDISSLRVATTGATTIPVDLIRRMHKDLGIDNVYSAYGLTESTGVVSLCRKGDDFKTIATTCGRPLPGTELRMVDNHGNDVTKGQDGEIWVRGFNVMQGYLDDPVASAETITSDGWLKTGDIGRQDSRGYIQVTDRKKDMVIVGGFNVYPAEVEKILLQHPQINDVAITAQSDARLGEVTHAHIVASEGSLNPEAVIEWSRKQMANYKVPRHISFHKILPRNASGKVQKFMLKT